MGTVAQHRTPGHKDLFVKKTVVYYSLIYQALYNFEWNSIGS